MTSERGTVGDGGMVRFSVSVPPELAEAFDRLTQSGGYANRSEAVRDLMRAHLVEEEWESASGQVVGAVTIVYDHHRPDLAKVLTRLQHHYLSEIICTTHVHLDERNCMEVIVLRGAASDVREIASALIAARGVKHGKLACTSTGAALP